MTDVFRKRIVRCHFTCVSINSSYSINLCKNFIKAIDSCWKAERAAYTVVQDSEKPKLCEVSINIVLRQLYILYNHIMRK